MKYVKSPLNYNGNKYKVIEEIVDLFPKDVSVFVDLFGGSGVVSLNTKAEHIIYNDIVPYVKNVLEGIAHSSNVEDVVSKIHSIINEYSLSKTNKEGFDKLRDDYNNGKKDWITFYTLVCYSFNTQYRFNNNHEYNSSFGKHKSHFSGVTEKKLRDSFDRLKELDISFSNKTFDSFDFSDFDENDFVYLDPPYYGSVGNYNDGKRGFLGWNIDMENKMRKLCENLDKQGVRFALSNNLSVNKTLEKWCRDNGFKIYDIGVSYNNSNYQKKNKNGEDREVLITNY